MSPDDRNRDTDLLAVNRWLSVSRLRSAAAIALFCLAIQPLGIATIALYPVLALCLLAALFSAWVLYNPRAARPPLHLYRLQAAFDLAVVTVGIGVAAEGVAALVFRALFVVIIVPISLVSAAGGIWVATGTSLAHLLLLGFERGLALATFTSVEATVPIFLFYVVAQQCMYYARHLEEKNEALERTTHSLRASERRLSGLIEVARTISSSADAQTLLARVNEAALSHLDADWAGTFLVDSTAGTFRPAVRSAQLIEPIGGYSDVPLRAFPFFDALRDQAVVRLSPAEIAEYPTLAVNGTRLAHFLFAGLRCDDELIGILGVGYFEAHEKRADTGQRELTSIVEHAAAALRNRQLLEEAQQASRLKTEFLSTVSHELRTPLNVILGYTDMIREGAAGRLNEEQADLFNRIDLQARDLYDLIEATLQVGRMTASEAILQLEHVAVADLVSSLAAAGARLPMAPQVALAWDVPADLAGTIRTDPANVRLVVRNLLSNAFKFTQRGAVTVRVRAEPAHLLVEVEDTGSGIPAEDFSKVFEMFRQLDGAGTGRTGGVGLGLYIVRQIVDRLGGSVNLSSTPGIGTTFSIRLPGYQPCEPNTANAAAPQPDRPLNKVG